jgi:hypothetical protein
MSGLRFNHVFFGLLALTFLSAMLLPSAVSKQAQINVQVLFAPIASPVRSLCAWAHDRLVPKAVRDDASPDQPRKSAEVYTENAALRQQIAMLTVELEKLRALESERNKLNWLRDLCTPYSVSGGDSGYGASLHLVATSFEGLKEGMPAIVPDGLVGRIGRVGVAGATVQLISARGTRLSVRIGRIESLDGGSPTFRFLTSTCIAEGQGGNLLLIPLVRTEELSRVRVNDMVVLDDPEWSPHLHAFRVGRVVDKWDTRNSPQFGQVKIESLVDLMQLREVMVMRSNTLPSPRRGVKTAARE